MKGIIIGTVAFIAGVGAGFLAGREYFKRQYVAITNEEIQSVKDTFKRREEELRAVLEQNVVEPEDKGATTKRVAYRELIRENPYELAKKQYNISNADLSPKKEAPEDDDDEEEDDEVRDAAGFTESEMQSRAERAEPYIIDERAYVDECSHFDKDILYYYLLDSTLCDENEDVVADVAGTIGLETTQMFGDGHMNLWIRNEPRSIDYEVIALQSAYSTTVAGFSQTMTPREKYEEKQRRKMMDDEE